jgi:predicted nucleic-acid-binding Zn-ribbon protein
MRDIDRMLLEGFSCAKCECREAIVERRAMAGTGPTRFFDIQPHEYAFVSCVDCGYTEVYSVRILKEILREHRG